LAWSDPDCRTPIALRLHRIRLSSVADHRWTTTRIHQIMKNPKWLRILPAAFRARIEHRSGLQRALANTGWLFGDKVLRMGMGLLVGVWVARYLGPAQFGLLNYATAFVALFGSIASLGLQGIVVRDLVREPEDTQEILGTAFVMQLLGGLLALAVAVSAITWLRPGDTLARVMVAILGSTLLFKAADVSKYWFEAKVQSKYTVIVENTVFLAMAVGKVGLILSGASLMAFVWITLVETVLVAAGVLWVYQRRVGALVRWQLHFARARSLLKESWPLILSGLAVMVYMRIDQIMLGEMLGDDAVGIYSAAVRISEVWYFVPMSIVASVFPAIIEAKKTSEELYLRRLQKLYDLMVVMALGVAIVMTFCSNWVVVLLFGKSYAAAGGVLAVHTWAGIFIFLHVASGKWLVMEGFQKDALYRALFGAFMNVGLNVILIPTNGVLGAAYATVISYFFAVFLVSIGKETRIAAWMMLKAFILHKAIFRLTS